MENTNNKKAVARVSPRNGSGGGQVSCPQGSGLPFRAFGLLLRGRKAGRATGPAVEHGIGFKGDFACGGSFRLYFSGTRSGDPGHLE